MAFIRFTGCFMPLTLIHVHLLQKPRMGLQSKQPLTHNPPQSTRICSPFLWSRLIAYDSCHWPSYRSLWPEANSQQASPSVALQITTSFRPIDPYPDLLVYLK